MVALLQPGLTRAALNDYRLGHILDALFAANLNGVFSAVALKALEVYAIPTPWLHQDTTTIALYGAYEDESQPPGAPRPAYGHSKDGRDDLKQVFLSLGVSGDGGVPLRIGVCDGNRSDSVEKEHSVILGMTTTARDNRCAIVAGTFAWPVMRSRRGHDAKRGAGPKT
jgi:transposase